MDATFECDGEFESEAERAKYRTWWIPNEDFTVYSGLDASVTRVREALQSKQCNALLGFSQGAALVSLVCQSYVTAASSPSVSQLEDETKPLMLAILAGGFLVRDTEYQTQLLKCLPMCKIPTLHIIGDVDQLVPPSRSMQLKELFPSAETYTHEGGHCVPTNKAAISAYQAFIQSALSSSSMP